MTPEKKIAYIITSVTEALDYAQIELNFIENVTFKYTGFGDYCTSKFLDMFIRKIKIITQEGDKDKKIPEKFYYAYSIKGLRNVLNDKWFLEKLLNVVNSSYGDRLSVFNKK